MQEFSPENSRTEPDPLANTRVCDGTNCISRCRPCQSLNQAFILAKQRVQRLRTTFRDVLAWSKPQKTKIERHDTLIQDIVALDGIEPVTSLLFYFSIGARTMLPHSVHEPS